MTSLRLLAPSIAACLMSVCVLPLGAASLIVNGSFETPVVDPGGYISFFSGSIGVTGWTVVGPGEIAVSSGAFTNACCSFPAQNGNQWLDLTGANSNSTGGVEQSISTFIGTQYTLSFF